MLLLRIILLFILFYLLLRLIGRILFGTKPYSSAGPGSNYNFHRKKEGEVNIDHQSNSKKKIIKKEEGEYIKFEEIKDE